MTICSKCIYDVNVPNITFDNEGVCSYCDQIEGLEKQYPTGEEGRKILDGIVAQIKKDSINKKYDVVLGVSGGADSSYLLHLLVEEYNLRVLAAHFDNSWNTTIATENINLMCDKLGVDLFTIVADNEEYDDLYRSFLKAGVKDVETPTDIALATTLYKAALKYNIKYMIEGHSFRTEGVAPLGWIYMDGRYIKSVHKEFGTKSLKNFPNLTMNRQIRWMLFNDIKKIRPIYYLDYDKEKVKQMLTDTYGWQWYGGHHLENRFTAFYHSYFLPRRWNIDFRIAGYAAYARNGWWSREKALQEMEKQPYLEDGLVEYVIDRLGYSQEEFDRIMNLPKRYYWEFKTYKPFFERFSWFFEWMVKLDKMPKSFILKYTKKDPNANKNK